MTNDAYMIQVYDQWLDNSISGNRSDKYLADRGFKRIVIYGMGRMGLRLYKELEDSDIDVVGCVDRNAGNIIYEGIEIKDAGNIPTDADVIVVTAVCYYDEVLDFLSNITDLPVISLEEIVYMI